MKGSGMIRFDLYNVRRVLWHLRHGGVAEAREFVRRNSSAGQRGAGKNPSVRAAVRRERTPVTVPAWPVAERSPRRGLRVATILDDFSSFALRYEWVQIPVAPGDWRQQVSGGNGDPQVDLLFVESAWHGNGDAWRYGLAGANSPWPELRRLVEWCRSQNVPTVFWNKEDPVHYRDFLETARLFDVVATTDESRVPEYRRDLGHGRVVLMPFAAQPAIHYPERSGEPLGDVAFAGMYFRNKFPERRAQMEVLLGGALDATPKLACGLDIFSRHLGGDECYQFPPEYDKRVVGSLTYGQMLTVYRDYKVFINVNSVTGSPSMCARRIFEISACGTPVVSGPSPAIENYFRNDMVIQVSERDQAKAWFRALCSSSFLRDQVSYRARMRIWEQHTYSHRVNDVLAATGISEHAWRLPRVTVMAVTNRPNNMSHIVRAAAGQRGVEVELVLAPHGVDVPSEVKKLGDRLGIGVRVLPFPSSVPLGECYNRIVKETDSPVLAKMDDDDDYGPYYLLEQLMALDYSAADVVGKQSHYVRFDHTKNILLYAPNHDERWTSFVPGPTIVARRGILEDIRFPALPRGEDTALLRGIVDAGGRIWSSSALGFMRHRSHSHTWSMSDVELMANGTVITSGDGRDHAMVSYEPSQPGGGSFLESEDS